MPSQANKTDIDTLKARQRISLPSETRAEPSKSPRQLSAADFAVYLSVFIFGAALSLVGILLCGPGLWRWAWIIWGGGTMLTAVVMMCLALTGPGPKQALIIGLYLFAWGVTFLGIGIFLCSPSFWRWAWIVAGTGITLLGAYGGLISAVRQTSGSGQMASLKSAESAKPGPQTSGPKSKERQTISRTSTRMLEGESELERKLWMDACKENTPEAYGKYLRETKMGTFAADAKSFLGEQVSEEELSRHLETQQKPSAKAKVADPRERLIRMAAELGETLGPQLKVGMRVRYKGFEAAATNGRITEVRDGTITIHFDDGTSMGPMPITWAYEAFHHGYMVFN